MTATVDPQLVERLTRQGDQPDPMFAVDEARTCEQCGISFTRKRASESHVRFAARRFCSPTCSGAHRLTASGPAAQKACVICGTVFFRKSGDGRWGKRRFCSHACDHQSRRKPKPVTPTRAAKPRAPRAVPPPRVRPAAVTRPTATLPTAKPMAVAPVAAVAPVQLAVAPWRPAGWPPVDEYLAQRGMAS